MSGHETLVDGHNAAHRLRLRGGSIAVREAVVDRVRALVRRGATVFFDGHPETGAFGGTEIHGVSVRFSGSEVADDSIVEYLRESKRPRTVSVVTDDRELRRRVTRIGARSIGVAEFFAKVPKASPVSDDDSATLEKPASCGLTAADFGLPEHVDLDAPPANLDARATPRRRTPGRRK